MFITSAALMRRKFHDDAESPVRTEPTGPPPS